jgi:hypothetical protein
LLELSQLLKERANMTETKDVFVIQKNGDKTHWHRAGVALVNRTSIDAGIFRLSLRRFARYFVSNPTNRPLR